MVIAFIVSLGLTAGILPFFIRYMHKRQFGQEILTIGPSWHEKKRGTPTMGGTVFLVATIVTVLLAMLFLGDRLKSVHDGLLFLLSLLGFGVIGFLDDGLKLFYHQNAGLSARQKFGLQVVMSAIVAVIAWALGSLQPIALPFGLTLGSPLLIGLFYLLWLVGFSNAYNLTDGIDGLAAGSGAISLAGYAAIAMLQGQADLALGALALIGGLLGFLLFNRKPARIFMGDVGSLAVGAGLALLSLLTGHPWSLLSIGLVYVIETLSVMIQVTVFRATRRRVFKMTPIHHHFELLGWSEWRIDLTAWALTFVLTIVTVWVVL